MVSSSAKYIACYQRGEAPGSEEMGQSWWGRGLRMWESARLLEVEPGTDQKWRCRRGITLTWMRPRRAESRGRGEEAPGLRQGHSGTGGSARWGGQHSGCSPQRREGASQGE